MQKCPYLGNLGIWVLGWGGMKWEEIQDTGITEASSTTPRVKS
jgi:hypothetical protein